MMGELVMEPLAALRSSRPYPIRLGLPKSPRSQGFSEFVGQITVDDD
jgi:hypothetical protein